MRAVCADFETELVEFNGEKDHVHLLVHYPPKVPSPAWSDPSRASPPSACARSSPTTSAATWGDHFWSPSYSPASAGGAPLRVTTEYIENQKRPD
jgi:putative transposase